MKFRHLLILLFLLYTPALLAQERSEELEKHLEAIKKNQVICFPNADLLQRPGPRFTEGVLKLREYLEK